MQISFATSGAAFRDEYVAYLKTEVASLNNRAAQSKSKSIAAGYAAQSGALNLQIAYLENITFMGRRITLEEAYELQQGRKP